MRTITVPVGPVPDRPARHLTGPEAVIVVVILSLAGALALAGLPAYGVMELVGAAVFLACRTVKGLREQPTAGPSTAAAA